MKFQTYISVMSLNEIRIVDQISKSLNITHKRIDSAIKLLGEGNTIPFIARYRKEVTDSLNETELRDIQREYTGLTNFVNRRNQIFKLISEQGKMSDTVIHQLNNAQTLQEVEDIYLPFKPKIQTLGAKAKAKGLGPLAEIIVEGRENVTIEEVATPFINTEKGVNTTTEAISGAIDIIAEDVGNDPEVRKYVRDVIFKTNVIKVQKSKSADEKSSGGAGDAAADGDDTNLGKKVKAETFELYFDFECPGNSLEPHQILAINRGEKLGFLDSEIVSQDDAIIAEVNKMVVKNRSSSLIEHYDKAVTAGYRRYIVRSIKREYMSELTEKASKHAIKVFALNLKNLLMTRPLKGARIIGIDPGYRTGCKVAVIDESGNFLENATIYPHKPQSKYEDAVKIVYDLAKKYKAYVLAIGNGTASRETEQMASDLSKRVKAKDKDIDIEYCIVSEAGASVYSASDIAIEEFPYLDLTVRGAISIARRLQDPLAELIKIDPKSIGIGEYQHDVNQTELKEELDAVIEEIVNKVGVDVNTASFKLLSYVSGLNIRTSKSIVEYRKINGVFKNRQEFLKVPGIGPKSYEQAAGFLKIMEPYCENPFDSTFVHPENYKLAEDILKRQKISLDGYRELRNKNLLEAFLNKFVPARIAEDLSVDRQTVRDIINDLLKPNLDPRDELPPQILRKDVLKMEDLEIGMVLKGTVRNVVDFGAFVDIGLKNAGLVHKSEMANRFVKNPHDVVAVGDIVDVRIVNVDAAKGKIGLSMKQVKQERQEKKENRFENETRGNVQIKLRKPKTP